LRNIYILAMALETVEDSIHKPLSVDDLAQSVYCSSSGLQKLFRYAFSCSVADYISKRRLSVASKELLQGTKSITDIAFDYQYASPEVFSRAFKKFWGVNPTEFRKTRRFSELFPKFENPVKDGGIIMQKRKPVDISELYDKLKSMAGTYILSIDIQSFASVNREYGNATGDIVIAESFHRIENEIAPDMLLFRIGGDEFAVVTGYSDLEKAEELVNRIVAKNGETVKVNGENIPVSLWVGSSKIPQGALNYREALEIMNDAIDSQRKSKEGRA